MCILFAEEEKRVFLCEIPPRGEEKRRRRIEERNKKSIKMKDINHMLNIAACLLPFVLHSDTNFLSSIFPSRSWSSQALLYVSFLYTQFVSWGPKKL